MPVALGCDRERDSEGRSGEQFLTELFEHELCSECGADEREHLAIPTPFGVQLRGAEGGAGHGPPGPGPLRDHSGVLRVLDRTDTPSTSRPPQRLAVVRWLVAFMAVLAGLALAAATYRLILLFVSGKLPLPF